MIIPLLIGLILLAAIAAVRFAVGSKRPIFAAASSLPIPSSGRSGRVKAFDDLGAGTNPFAVTWSPATRNQIRHFAASDNLLKKAKDIRIIRPSSSNRPVKITPNIGVISIRPSKVVRIRPAIGPATADIVKPQESEVIRPSQVLVVAPSPVAVTKVAPSRVMAVEVPQRGAWDERGWTKNMKGRHEIYEGYYHVGRQQYRGRIEVRGRDISAYISDPPREIKRHAHGACFQQVGNGWFILHWARPARNVDDAILYMEKILDESLSRK